MKDLVKTCGFWWNSFDSGFNPSDVYKLRTRKRYVCKLIKGSSTVHPYLWVVENDEGALTTVEQLT